MSWVGQVIDETGRWAIVHTPDRYGFCMYGHEPFTEPHRHAVHDSGEPCRSVRIPESFFTERKSV